MQLTKCQSSSPEDHAVLEAEYKKNPKPDKAARTSIVSRVALGEKEVQVRVFDASLPRFRCSGVWLTNCSLDLVSKQTTERPSKVQTSRAP
jgi:hypothetical protein